MNHKQKILITGSNGLLGNRLVEKLSNDHDIYAIVRNKPDSPLERVTYLEIDLSKHWDIKILPQEINTIIHLAQSSKFRHFPDEADDIFNVNIQSTLLLLDYAYKNDIKKFIYASSGGIYGTDSKAFDENSPIPSADTLGFYLGSKLCGEVLVRNYTSHFDVMTLRFFFMYGPEQNDTMLIPRLVNNIKKGDAILLQGQDGIKINPIHVDDAVTAVQKSLSLKGSYVFNIGGENTYSLREIAEIISQSLNKEVKFKILNDQAKDIIGDITGMKNKLHTPLIDFHEGIKDFS